MAKKEKSHRLMETIKEARARGISVSYRKRSDGGIRITKIAGKKADAGQVAYLRELTGTTLTSKEEKQRAYARKRILPSDVRKAYDKFLGVAKDFKFKGTIKRSTLLNTIKNVGKTEARAILARATLRAKGLAGTAESEGLEMRLKRTQAMLAKYYHDDIFANMKKPIAEWMNMIENAWKKIAEARAKGKPITNKEMGDMAQSLYDLEKDINELLSAINEGEMDEDMFKSVSDKASNLKYIINRTLGD